MLVRLIGEVCDVCGKVSVSLNAIFKMLCLLWNTLFIVHSAKLTQLMFLFMCQILLTWILWDRINVQVAF